MGKSNEPECAARVERWPLLKALQLIDSVIELKNTIPILSHVLIEGDGETIRLTGTNLDQQAVQTIPARVEVPFATTVSSARLMAVVAGFAEGSEIALSLGAGELVLRAGRARAALKTLPRDDFPLLVTGDAVAEFSMNGKRMAACLARISYAICTEPHRYYLNGVFWHRASSDGGKTGKLTMVATDGHNLAREQLDMDVPDLPDVIIPHRAVTLLARALKDVDEDVEISVGDKLLRFEWGSSSYATKKIDGQFPDYTRVIPLSNDKLLHVDPRSLTASIARATAVAVDKTRAVRLDLDADRCTISATSPEFGHAADECPVSWDSGAFTVGCNAAYLKSALDAVGSDSAAIHFADPRAPIRFERVVPDGFVGVLMPMNV